MRRPHALPLVVQRSGVVGPLAQEVAMHIGLIGGIGPAATEYYYRGLIARHARSNTHLELTIAHADARELVHNLFDRLKPQCIRA